MSTAPEHDDVLSALEELAEALDETAALIDRARPVIELIRTQRAGGHTYGQIVSAKDESVVEIVTDMLRTLFDAGHRLRQAEARALVAEGFTMQHVGEVFGVSRQRIAELVRPPRGARPEWWGETRDPGPQHDP